MMYPASQHSPCDTTLEPPFLVIGNDQALYREVLSSSVAALRPEMSVFTASPGEIDSLLLCLQPLLVVCSALSAAIESQAGAWILLHPDVEQPTVVGVRWKRRSIPHPQLDELVQLIEDLLADLMVGVSGPSA